MNSFFSYDAKLQIVLIKMVPTTLQPDIISQQADKSKSL